MSVDNSGETTSANTTFSQVSVEITNSPIINDSTLLYDLMNGLPLQFTVKSDNDEALWNKFTGEISEELETLIKETVSETSNNLEARDISFAKGSLEILLLVAASSHWIVGHLQQLQLGSSILLNAVQVGKAIGEMRKKKDLSKSKVAPEEEIKKEQELLELEKSLEKIEKDITDVQSKMQDDIEEIKKDIADVPPKLQAKIEETFQKMAEPQPSIPLFEYPQVIRGSFEIGLPLPPDLLQGSISTSIFKSDGVTPAKVIDVDQAWSVEITWKLSGTIVRALVPMISGKWSVRLFFEDPDPDGVNDFALVCDEGLIPWDPDDSCYQAHFSVPGGTIKVKDMVTLCSVSVSVTYLTSRKRSPNHPDDDPSSYKAGPMVGFVEVPLTFFYSKGIKP